MAPLIVIGLPAVLVGLLLFIHSFAGWRCSLALRGWIYFGEARPLLDRALNFYCKELGLDPSTITLGACFEKHETGMMTSNTKNTKFLIALSLRHPDELLDSLAHECIHVHQIVRGDLDPHWGFSTVLWSGRPYSRFIPELEKPWEIEAYTKSPFLYLNFLKREVALYR